MLQHTPDVAATTAGVQFHRQAERENDRTTTAAVHVSLPVTPEIAGDIMPEMVDSLYELADGNPLQKQPKGGVKQVSFDYRSKALLIVALATAPGGRKPKITMSGVTVKAVLATRTETGWTVTFTLKFPLPAAKDAVPFIDSIGDLVYLTFSEQAPAIDYDTRVPGSDPPAEASVDEGGVVTDIKTGRGKKKSKNPPEEPAEETRH